MYYNNISDTIMNSQYKIKSDANINLSQPNYNNHDNNKNNNKNNHSC